MNRIPIPDGAEYIEFGPAAPTPEPAPSMFPPHIMPWLYPGDQYFPWLEAHNLVGAQQYWSSQYNPWLRPAKMPYMFENHADAIHGDGKYKRQFDQADNPAFIEAMARHCNPANTLLTGVNVDCEIARDREWLKGDRVVAYLRERYPHVKLVTGPLWPGMEERYGMFDGLVAFANVTRADRFPEDLGGYCRAITNYYGLPCSMSVQPVDSEAGMWLADPDLFAQGMGILGEMFDGGMVWKAEGLAKIAAGELDTVTPGRFDPIMETIRNFRFDRRSTRPKLRIKMNVLDYKGKAPANIFNIERMETRVVYRAGLEPVGSRDDADERFIWERTTLADREIFRRFHQWDHGDRDGTERDRMIEIENRLAEWVKANYGGE